MCSDSGWRKGYKIVRVKGNRLFSLNQGQGTGEVEYFFNKKDKYKGYGNRMTCANPMEHQIYAKSGEKIDMTPRGPLCVFKSLDSATAILDDLKRSNRGNAVKLFECIFVPSKAKKVWYGKDQTWLGELYGGTFLAVRVRLIKEIE